MPYMSHNILLGNILGIFPVFLFLLIFVKYSFLSKAARCSIGYLWTRALLPDLSFPFYRGKQPLTTAVHSPVDVHTIPSPFFFFCFSSFFLSSFFLLFLLFTLFFSPSTFSSSSFSVSWSSVSSFDVIIRLVVCRDVRPVKRERGEKEWVCVYVCVGGYTSGLESAEAPMEHLGDTLWKSVSPEEVMASLDIFKVVDTRKVLFFSSLD